MKTLVGLLALGFLCLYLVPANAAPIKCTQLRLRLGVLHLLGRQ